MPFPEADAALERCLESFKGQYDELILVVNDGMGYGPAVNLGLKWASGENLVVCNNDIQIVKGSLRDLIFTDGFMIPKIEPEPRDYKPRSIFCMSRWIYEAIYRNYGFFYDPDYKTGYFEDDDLHIRMGDIPYFQVEDVVVNHLDGGGLTMKTQGEQKWFDINEKVFKGKWS